MSRRKQRAARRKLKAHDSGNYRHSKPMSYLAKLERLASEHTEEVKEGSTGSGKRTKRKRYSDPRKAGLDPKEWT